ncbi:hypothetical protein KPH14_001140 [Odynerus spinipes]|uniref:HAUS augmin-like complex subunit 6 N-terminal domain-containing protein n=1 Tax=Odynerus spinipes TaxID=1348599 RepID=A0AAD9VR98_9HYME|nr:hypothetical protein KPH14_001140 [Odynerus spinipes]
MSISEYLYNNVLLLIKVVPPPYDFNKYFSKDMFNKPNTPAFICVSHYLLNIYDAKRFQTTIKWPMFGKAEEAIYCTEIRNYLTILSSENPDMNFPVMLKIHFLKASGKIFLIIMWKLSIIVLRAYLKRKDKTNILWAPSEGITNDLVNKSLNNIISHKKATLMSFMDNNRTKEEEFTILKKCELDHMNRIESEIFKTWEHIEILLQSAPVHPMIIKKLRDTERNPEIISMWKEHICHSISYVREANIMFKELSNLSNNLNSLASYLCTDMILDGSQFHLNPGKKDFVSKFNFNGQLNLQDFVSLLNMTLKETRTSFEVQKLPNVSPLKLEVSKCSDTIKSMILSLRTMHSHVSKIKTKIQYNSQQRNTNSTLATNCLSTKSTLNFHHSPKIKFTSKSDAHCKAALNRICESPIIGKYKHLFSKYKRKQIKPSILLTLQKDNQNEYL